MAEDVFPGIDFTLPAQGKLNAAREIGRQCGTAWYAHNTEALPPGFPNSVSTWSVRCRRAWREGLVNGWHAAKTSAPPPSAAPISKGMLVGYARVSTQDQSTRALKSGRSSVAEPADAGVLASIFEDRAPGF